MSATILLIFTILAALAQENSSGRLAKFERSMPASIQANEGSIILNDGTELTGMVSYNEQGVLKFEGAKELKVLGAKQVVGFEVYDPAFEGTRIFYLLPKTDKESGVKSPYFFELLEDFKSFAVLLVRDPSDVNSSGNLIYGSNGFMKRQEASVVKVETFYLFKQTGEPEPYFYNLLEIRDSNVLVADSETTTRKFLNEDLLPKYMGEYFESVKSYAKTNRYSFKDKSDFLKILAYYQTLVD